MRSWWRKLKAVLGLGTIWGGACAAVGAVIGLITGLVTGSFAAPLLVGTLGFGAAGFILGTGFALALSVMEGRRTLEQLTPRRAGMWGAAVGALVPTVTNLVSITIGGSVLPAAQMVPVLIAAAASYGILTGALAAGTVALAKRAPELGAAPPTRILDRPRDSTELNGKG